MRICICTCVCVCMCICACMCVCIHIYIYIYIYLYSGGELREAQRCVQDAEHKSPHNLSAYVYGSLLKGTSQHTPPQDLISSTSTILSEHTSPHNLSAYLYGSRLKRCSPTYSCSCMQLLPALCFQQIESIVTELVCLLIH